ncbi:Rieske (2Fe-2S) protein [Humibacillus sp. DSM 29435]|uniref:Rieske (2Fe-2S) protein n=1 Tax=Humibacillus sp. DSM 29435 TaxID=1869167 RepID=UPI0009F30EB3|nr:Rieske (2Fe-2S) protein [Humibacillus sp. DSM 29435]
MTPLTHSDHTTPSSRSGDETRSTPANPDGPQIDAIRRLTDRRGVLKAVGLGVGVVAGAGVLAACSSPPVQPDTSAQSATPLSTSAGVTPSETPSTGSAAAGGTPTSQVPVGGGTIFAATKTVVTQPQAGTFRAFDSTCPHQGCAVATVADGKINCPCHGSEFDINTGDRVAGPAPTGLTAKTITVTGGSFTVA